MREHELCTKLILSDRIL